MKYTAHIIVALITTFVLCVGSFAALQLNVVQEEIGKTLKRGGEISFANFPLIRTRTSYSGIPSVFGKRCGSIDLDRGQAFMDYLGPQKDHWMPIETAEMLMKRFSYHENRPVDLEECNKELPPRYVINDQTGPRRIMYDLDRLNNEGHLVEIGSISVNSPCRIDSPLIMAPNWYIAQNENGVVGFTQCEIEK